MNNLGKRSPEPACNLRSSRLPLRGGAGWLVRAASASNFPRNCGLNWLLAGTRERQGGGEFKSGTMARQESATIEAYRPSVPRLDDSIYPCFKGSRAIFRRTLARLNEWENESL